MPKEHETVIIYEQVRKNQIKTVLLIALYVAVIFAICIAIGYYADSMVYGIGIGCVVVFVILPIQMATGGMMMGSRTHWREANLSDIKEDRVYNLIEGLSLAAGLKDTPKLYIVPAAEPNAFAGGLKLKNSYIGVTTGLIKIMDEPEIEGVLAHEMSHIIQRDVLVSTVSVYLMSAAIILGGMLYRMSRYSMRYGGPRKKSDSKDNSAAVLAAIAVTGLVLSFFIKIVARLINLAISRKREYAADANAVRLCGYSEGLADALEKIKNYSPSYSKEQVENLGGDEMMCLYIYNPSQWVMPLFSTHPPIEERIRLLRNMY